MRVTQVLLHLERIVIIMNVQDMNTVTEQINVLQEVLKVHLLNIIIVKGKTKAL